MPDSPGKSTRTKFESRIRVAHDEKGDAIFRTGDISDGGVFLWKGPFDLHIGDEVTAQIQDVPFEPPVVKMRVVRVDPDGYGLSFIADAAE